MSTSCARPIRTPDIRKIDTAKAKSAPGVIAVLTGADAEAEGIKGLPPAHLPPPVPSPPFAPDRPLLCAKTVKYVGDPVAMVVAETLAQAKDAAELIEVDYKPRDFVADTAAAAKSKAKVWSEMDSNVWIELHFPHDPAAAAAVDAALKGSAHVTKLTIYNNRLSTNSMETRGCVAAPHQLQDKVTLYTSSQIPHKVREVVARDVLHMPERSLQVVSGDVGGGFGLKGEIYPEEALCVWAARKTGRPVRWVPDRAEAMLSDSHGRDLVSVCELGLDKDGRITAMRIDNTFNLGAYLMSNGIVTPMLGTFMLSHAYDFPQMLVATRMVMTNMVPTTPYRGAGRPEANYIVDRLIDTAAAEMGIDKAELRRKNFIQPSAMPYQTKLMHNYDCGDFAMVMDKGLAAADWKGFAKRKAESEKRGKLRGQGLTYYIEACGIFNERMELRFDPSGDVTVIAGTHSHGQGHETAFAQLVNEYLGIPDRERPADPGRHRRGAVRARDVRLALAVGRRLGDQGRGRQADRQGQEMGRAHARGGRGRHRVRRRHVHRRRHRQEDPAEEHRHGVVRADGLPDRARRRARGGRRVGGACPPSPTAAWCARSRSTPRPA